LKKPSVSAAAAQGSFPTTGASAVKYVRHNRCERIFLLQGLMECAYCGNAMTARHYVFHRSGRGRRKDSFVCHYVCTQYRKTGSACDYMNRVLARSAEEWMLEPGTDP
jgi:hypothetical protein